ncbi:MAG: DNA repair protein RecN [Bacteroidaceae bacterium]|nr:DNA repair protein RecN [Bacteroidaceae bacterium]MBQ9192040.1 DNA repair protein RecN [Bacteroidaceae bacterium]
MLQSLFIKNYALIDELHINFHRGFSVITGETGAGKSILLGAIGLLLGQRADARSVKAGENRCIIEAEFDLSGYGLDEFFESEDLDFDGQSCIIRRELTAAGKSRAFINDTPASVAQLKMLGSRLIDIHSQHQNLLLAQEDFQLSVVDIIAGNQDVRRLYEQHFQHYRQTLNLLREAKEAAQRDQDEEDYLRFQLSQIDDLHLETGKQEELEMEARQLEHAEEIRETLWSTETLLSGDSGNLPGVVQTLRDAERQLSSITSLLPQADALAERLNSCRIELDDIASEVSSQAERIDVNPSRLEQVNDWLSSLYTLQKKHHLNTEDELIQLADDFRQRLEATENAESRIQELTEAAEKAHKDVIAAGKELTTARMKAAKEVERQMTERLQPLGIPNVKFQVSVTPRKEPDATGFDQVVFLFSANKNGRLEPVSEVASGGEIARVMLSLKAMISASVSLPTIIFDEIDTGVSGQIAERMAEIMRQMGDGGRQVISITHLPQIAALGEHHYRVYKEDNDQGTTSHILQLNTDERITEIAHLLSGAQLTDAAIQNAKSLLRI